MIYLKQHIASFRNLLSKLRTSFLKIFEQSYETKNVTNLWTTELKVLKNIICSKTKTMIFEFESSVFSQSSIKPLSKYTG